MSQIPEHVKRGHRAPNDYAWAKESLPSPEKASRTKTAKESTTLEAIVDDAT